MWDVTKGISDTPLSHTRCAAFIINRCRLGPLVPFPYSFSFLQFDSLDYVLQRPVEQQSVRRIVIAKQGLSPENDQLLIAWDTSSCCLFFNLSSPAERTVLHKVQSLHPFATTISGEDGTRLSGGFTPFIRISRDDVRDGIRNRKRPRNHIHWAI